MNEYKVVYIAPPISEIPKTKIIKAIDSVKAVKVLEQEIGREVEGLISIELID
tara:strand:- start:71 stop:229 length:159 start_codon:yes stop_codon:yes gene_type:complete